MEVKNIYKCFGGKKIFEGFSLELNDPVTAVMGASGVGKTTLLRIMAGLEKCQGRVVKADKLSFVFQDGALVENLTVLKNVEIACGSRERALKALGDVELRENINLYPKALSGGMKQRVNMARAFAHGGTILMDEPFKMLDYALKQRIMELFKKLREEQGNKVVLVTHDVEEAIYLADRVIVLAGTPAQVVYDGVASADKKQKILELIAGE